MVQSIVKPKPQHELEKKIVVMLRFTTPSGDRGHHSLIKVERRC
jgi:hypothetical protein